MMAILDSACTVVKNGASADTSHLYSPFISKLA